MRAFARRLRCQFRSWRAARARRQTRCQIRQRLAMLEGGRS